MNCGGEAGYSGGNVGQVTPKMQGGDRVNNCMRRMNDQAIQATGDDYCIGKGDASVDNHPYSNDDGKIMKVRSGSEHPSRDGNLHGDGSWDTRKIFFKTKLCCKFDYGICPYIANCNFAHGIEELREPPPNWQEIIAATGGNQGLPSEMWEEHQMSSSLSNEAHRSYKRRQCWKYLSEEGCLLGDDCNFLHEPLEVRESDAINLRPTMGGHNANRVIGPDQKPSNWKTRLCYKWKNLGFCPFGKKCYFAHGLEDLHRHGGLPEEVAARCFTSVTSNLKQIGGSLKRPRDNEVRPAAKTLLAAPTHPAPRTSLESFYGPDEKPGPGSVKEGRGPKKISKVYGDWFDDL